MIAMKAKQVQLVLHLWLGLLNSAGTTKHYLQPVFKLQWIEEKHTCWKWVFNWATICLTYWNCVDCWRIFQKLVVKLICIWYYVKLKKMVLICNKHQRILKPKNDTRLKAWRGANFFCQGYFFTKWKPRNLAMFWIKLITIPENLLKTRFSEFWKYFARYVN